MTERPVVWLFALCWNDAHMLPFFFRHYDDWVDRYLIFDDGSTDGSLSLLATHPRVTVRRFERVFPESFVWSATYLQDRVWQEARGQADWVVITAIDEHLYHPDIPGYLAGCRAAGITALPALGFNMLSDTFPAPGERLAETRCIGAPHWEMNKLSLFDPEALTATNYWAGRHIARPQGRVVYAPTDAVLNLHYKYMGRDHVAARHRMLWGGLGDYDRSVGLGAHYAWPREKLDARWEALRAMAMDYRDPSVGISTHAERWWRGTMPGSVMESGESGGPGSGNAG